MKIGMITDSPGAPSFGKLLGTAAELGIYRLEFAAGNRLQRAAPDVRPDGRQPVGTTGVSGQARQSQHLDQRPQLLWQPTVSGCDRRAALTGHL